MSEPCAACKTIPPVVTKNDDYKDKGSFIDIADHRCYVSSPHPQPKTGVLIIYDIFGMPFYQTRQGADIIAFTEPGHLVVMPDLFHGAPIDISNFPPDTDEKKKTMGAFFQGPAQTAKNVEAGKKIMAALKEKYPDVQKWGVFGYCWGGKVATLLSIQTDFFAAAGQTHPAMLDTKDIENSSVPHLCLASQDEDSDTIAKYGEILQARNDGASHLSHYTNDKHGWMAARSNLEVESEKASYEKGYKEVVDFFAKTLNVLNSRL